MTTIDPRPRTSDTGGDAELFEIDDFIGDGDDGGRPSTRACPARSSGG